MPESPKYLRLENNKPVTIAKARGGHSCSAPHPTTQLEAALKTAVSAACEAEKHAAAIGYNVRFTPADIRAMGETRGMSYLDDHRIFLRQEQFRSSIDDFRRIARHAPLKRTPLKRRKRKPQPGDDPEYLDWIRSLPCWICTARSGLISVFTGASSNTQHSPTEAAHVGDRAYGRKCPDREAIPLCGIEHHREGPESDHKLTGNFWAHHNLDRAAIIRRLNAEHDSGYLAHD